MSTLRLPTRATFAAVMVGVFLLAGCGGEYSQGSVSTDSQEARQVSGMIEVIRSSKDPATDPRIDEQFSSEEDPDMTKALRSAVVSLAKSPGLELVSLDRFGEQVYRVCFTFGQAPQTQRKTILLVSVDGRLRWAKVN